MRRIGRRPEREIERFLFTREGIRIGAIEGGESVAERFLGQIKQRVEACGQGGIGFGLVRISHRMASSVFRVPVRLSRLARIMCAVALRR